MSREKLLLLLGEVFESLAGTGLQEEGVLEAVLAAAMRAADAERGFVIALDEEGRVDCIAAVGVDKSEIATPDQQISQTIVKKVVESGEPFASEDATKEESLSGAASVFRLNIKSVLCVPIQNADTTIGALYLESKGLSCRFTQEKISLIGKLAQCVSTLVEGARKTRSLQRQVDALRRRINCSYRYGDLIGRSPQMQRVFKLLERIRNYEAPVLICGETGTGKDLVARIIHNESPRADGPFIAVNCGAIPETLLEDELFGHIRGAFTSAENDRAGLIESADGGTLFLDEVETMPPAMQVKLLRVLEDGQVRRIGSNTTKPVNIRLICATNRDLQQLLKTGAFRDDLYYRIAVIRIQLPPLRQRREDIPLLATEILNQLNAETGCEKRLSSAAIKTLLTYDWKGNVRELRNTLYAALLASHSNTIQPEDLPIKSALKEPPKDLRQAKTELTKAAILDALSQTGGNRTKAAKLLGISRRWLTQLIRRFAIKT